MVPSRYLLASALSYSLAAFLRHISHVKFDPDLLHELFAGTGSAGLAGCAQMGSLLFRAVGSENWPSFHARVSFSDSLGETGKSPRPCCSGHAPVAQHRNSVIAARIATLH